MNTKDSNQPQSPPSPTKDRAMVVAGPRTLEEWTHWLKDQEMPIFSRTVQRLNLAVEDKRAGVMELSRIILEDPSLTAKLLKLSNTPYYNPGRQNLATVTRAIIVIGLNAICDLAIACSFIESILTQRNKQRVNQEIAKSLHAAVQARSLAVLCQDPSPEEVFIAALLHNIGHIAFWCFEKREGDEITRLVTEKNVDLEEAEKDVLGFKLKQLGSALSRTWNLGSLVVETFKPGAAASRRCEIVRLGCEVAQLSARGWNAVELQRTLAKATELTGKPVKEIDALLKSNAGTAIKLATQFGASEAAAYIPGADKMAIVRDVAEETRKDKGEITLLQVMQEISNALSREINLNMLFQMVMGGIYRSLHMDRVLFALLTPDRKFLKEKSSLGWPGASTQGPLQIPVARLPENLFSYAMDRNEAIWTRKDADSPFAGLYTPSIANLIGCHECMLAPVGLQRKIIGCFYADRALQHNPMDQETFEGFRQITQQANIALKLSQIQN